MQRRWPFLRHLFDAGLLGKQGAGGGEYEEGVGCDEENDLEEERDEEEGYDPGRQSRQEVGMKKWGETHGSLDVVMQSPLELVCVGKCGLEDAVGPCMLDIALRRLLDAEGWCGVDSRGTGQAREGDGEFDWNVSGRGGGRFGLYGGRVVLNLWFAGCS